jgi:hypothetical protein
MPLPTSKRKAALLELKGRLGYIQVAKGFNTDAGLHIFVGEWPRLGPDDAREVLAIAVGDETIEVTDSRIISKLPVEVWALVPGETENPQLAIEDIITDIKQAVEVEENPTQTRALGMMEAGVPIGTTPKGLSRGVTRSLRRSEGSSFVGAAVEYELTFEESWGGAGR